MSLSNMAPTLLIGVGGMGCRIVNEVVGRLKPDSNPDLWDNFGVQGFDTDTNELDRLTNLKHKVTQTSSTWTVGQYLDEHSKEGLTTWFPAEYPLIKDRNLTEGAGQIRAISRLALRSKMEAGLDNVREELNRLTTARGDTTARSIRIIVVGSLMGGTGSGIFIQLGLYLRDLLQHEFQTKNVLIRGAFMLPDVLLNGGVSLPADQHPNILANAYAALKELDAISNNAQSENSGSDQARSMIELEFRPKQVNEQGELSAVLPKNKYPYNYVFLWDYQQAGIRGGIGRGMGLGSAENYQRQMVDAIYLQLFSPIGSRQFSVEDNNILAVIGQNGRNRYGSAGVASLEYPYEDILDYCACRWSDSTISNQWRKLDDEFSQIMEKYERDRRNGIYQEQKPDRVLQYCVSFKLRVDANDRIFRRLRNSLWEGKDTDPEKIKSKRFVRAVESQIEKLIGKHEELQTALQEANLKRDTFERQDQAWREQNRTEEALARLKDIVMDVTDKLKESIVSDILWEGLDAVNPRQVLQNPQRQQEHVLNYWLVEFKEGLHPLVVRYLLCDIYKIINERLEDLIKRNTDTLTSIEGYKDRYDLRSTPEKETHNDRLNTVLSKNRFLDMIKGEFRDWVKTYSKGAKNQRDHLNSYAIDKLTEQVFKAIQEALNPDDGLIGQYHQFFDQLQQEAEQLQAQSERLSTLHDAEERENTTRMFACASAKAKEALWTEVEKDDRIGSDDLHPDICAEIHFALYRRAWQKIYRRKDPDQPVNRIYRDRVQPWARGKIVEKCGRILDKNIVQAILDQAKIDCKDESENKLLSSALQKIDMLAQPFLVARHFNEKNQWQTWGMGKSIQDALFQYDVTGTLNINNDVVNDGFDQYKIVRYRTRYGYKAEDFSKFSASGEIPGSYYMAYRNRIREVVEGSQPTPHLDKRWHLPAYMDDLNETVAIKEKMEQNRAFLLGLAHGRLRLVTEDGEKRWRLIDQDGDSHIVKYFGRNAGGTLPELYKSMGFNPFFVAQVLSISKRKWQQDKEKFPALPGCEQAIEQHEFVSGLLHRREVSERNIIDELIDMPLSDHTDAKMKGIAHVILLNALCDLLLEYYADQFGSERRNDAKRAALAFMTRLLDESESYKGSSNGLQEGFRDKINSKFS